MSIPDPSEDETQVFDEDNCFLARRAAKEQVMSGALHNWQDQISTCCGARIDWKHSAPMLCTRCDKECEATTGEALKARISFLEGRNGILSELAASNAGEAHKARRERDEALRLFAEGVAREARLREALELITTVQGGDDCGGTTWQCAETARAALSTTSAEVKL